MPNNCLLVLYKHIIQVEIKNVGLKVCGGGGTNIPLPPPPIKKVGGHMPPLPPRFLRQWTWFVKTPFSKERTDVPSFTLLSKSTTAYYPPIYLDTFKLTEQILTPECMGPILFRLGVGAGCVCGGGGGVAEESSYPIFTHINTQAPISLIF